VGLAPLITAIRLLWNSCKQKLESTGVKASDGAFPMIVSSCHYHRPHPLSRAGPLLSLRPPCEPRIYHLPCPLSLPCCWWRGGVPWRSPLYLEVYWPREELTLPGEPPSASATTFTFGVMPGGCGRGRNAPALFSVPPSSRRPRPVGDADASLRCQFFLPIRCSSYRWLLSD
jgi:hypothetical protein